VLTDPSTTISNLKKELRYNEVVYQIK